MAGCLSSRTWLLAIIAVVAAGLVACQNGDDGGHSAAGPAAGEPTEAPATPKATPAETRSLPAAAGPTPALGERAVLLVTLEIDGPNTALLQSPSLRCAADFCAGFALLALREAEGIVDARSYVVDWDKGEWGFLVRYAPDVIGPEEVVAVYQRSLEEYPDPAYPAPHDVQWRTAQTAREEAPSTPSGTAERPAMTEREVR